MALRLEILLEHALQNFGSPINITGSSYQLPLAWLLARPQLQKFQQRPHLVIVPSDEIATELYDNICSLNPNASLYRLHAFDVSPYSQLDPNHSIIGERLRWLNAAYESKPSCIFIASIDALLQKTLPVSTFLQLRFHLETNNLLPDGLKTRLLTMGYQQVPLVEDIGQFSRRGDILDIFSPALNKPVRIELFGDSIEAIKTFEPTTQRSLEPIKSVTIVPTLETIYFDEDKQSLIERFRVSTEGRNCDAGEVQQIQHNLLHSNYFAAVPFLLPIIPSPVSFSPRRFFVGLWIPYPSLKQPTDYDSVSTGSFKRTLKALFA